MEIANRARPIAARVNPLAGISLASLLAFPLSLIAAVVGFAMPRGEFHESGRDRAGQQEAEARWWMKCEGDE